MSQDLFSPESFQTEQPDFLDQHPTIPIPERMTVVPSWYQRHQDIRGTVVMQKGVPVQPGFTVAEVAPELRWAILEDGELLGQLEFRQMHEKWYTEQYRFVGQPSDDPNLRSVPLVERFVARRVDPNDPSRLQPIVRVPEQSAPVQPVFNANGDRIEDAGAVAAPPNTQIKEPTADEAKAQEASGFVTPCGKPMAAKRYMPQHTRSCENPECVALTESLRAEKD